MKSEDERSNRPTTEATPDELSGSESQSSTPNMLGEPDHSTRISKRWERGEHGSLLDAGDSGHTGFVDVSYLAPPSGDGSLGKLDHYDVQSVLGQGGFGTVFKAYDEKLHRTVAIKVMRPVLAANPTSRQRFLREARSAASINHPNVVQVFGVGETPLPHLVMECIDGITLSDLLKQRGTIDAQDALRLGTNVARGLSAAHDAGVIHRDIKPSNILIQLDDSSRENSAPENWTLGSIKLTDFGLARAVDDVGLTQSGFIAGTPQYMAPEQALETTVDARADLFSLGSVLYQATSGRPPFLATRTISVIRQVCDQQPVPIQKLNPTIPNWCAAIIQRLHKKDPADRYQSAQEVAELMEHCLEQVQRCGSVRSLDLKPFGHKRAPWRWWTPAIGITLLIVAAVCFPRAPTKPEPVATTASTIPSNATERADEGAIAVILEALKRRNPGYDGSIDYAEIDPNGEASFRFIDTVLTDLSPFASAKTVNLELTPDYLDPTKLYPLDSLESLRGAPLKRLMIDSTHVSDLSPLAKMPIEELLASWTLVDDLSAIGDCPIRILHVSSRDEDVTFDAKSIAHFSLEQIYIQPEQWKNLTLLESIESLTLINGIKASAFWATYEEE